VHLVNAVRIFPDLFIESALQLLQQIVCVLREIDKR